eukprot:13522589-Alexandrium_andersonii.AAC.1
MATRAPMACDAEAAASTTTGTTPTAKRNVTPSVRGNCHGAMAELPPTCRNVAGSGQPLASLA